MKVAVLTALERVEVQEQLEPECGIGEVKIRIEAVGICGSDVHYYQHGHIGKRSVQFPHVQGHEASGVVLEVDSSVTNIQVGDRVIIEPGIHCETCSYCREGRYHLCEAMYFLSTPPNPGLLKQIVTVPSRVVFPIADELNFEIATLAEPLSVGIHALRRADLKPGQTVYISGMGPVGLVTVLAARAFGAGEITVGDFQEDRLTAAKKIGATHALDVRHEKCADEAFDVVIETSGSGIALNEAIRVTKKGGTIVAVGFPSKEVPLDIIQMIQKEIDLKTVYRYVHTFPLSLKILEQYPHEASLLITSTFPMKEVQEAMQRATTLSHNDIKIVVKPND